jgi:hypothetical protein
VGKIGSKLVRNIKKGEGNSGDFSGLHLGGRTRGSMDLQTGGSESNELSGEEQMDEALEKVEHIPRGSGRDIKTAGDQSKLPEGRGPGKSRTQFKRAWRRNLKAAVD